MNGIIDPRGHVVIQSSSLISLSLNFNHKHNFIVCDSANYIFNTSRAYFFFVIGAFTESKTHFHNQKT